MEPARKRTSKAVATRGAGVVAYYVDEVRRASPVDLMQMERDGVPGSLVEHISARINMPKQRLYRVLGAPKATMERKISSKGTIAGAPGQATLGIVRLLALAEEIVANSTAPQAKGFDTGRWLGEWLETPQPALGGRRPAEMLDTPTGLQVVERTLGAIESGSFQY